MLEQILILSRHSIRAPFPGNEITLSDITPHAWHVWSSAPGELSLRGAELEEMMGQYFRNRLEEDGVSVDDAGVQDRALRFYASSFQRTQASARCFAAGLTQGKPAVVEQHGTSGTENAVFVPLVASLDETEKRNILQEIARKGGGDGLPFFRKQLEEPIRLLYEITDLRNTEGYRRGKTKSLLEKGNQITLENGKRPSMTGAVRSATWIADALIMQFYEESDDRRAAFGHVLTEDAWRQIGRIPECTLKWLFADPLLAPNLARPMLREMIREWNTNGRFLTYLCGHDSTLTCVLAALEAEDYDLAETVEPAAPVAGKLVFERRRDEKGEKTFSAYLVYPTVDQIRGRQVISKEYPPVRIPIRFRGAVYDMNGNMPEKDFMQRLMKKADTHDET